jgi:hypothetical protein
MCVLPSFTHLLLRRSLWTLERLTNSSFRSFVWIVHLSSVPDNIFLWDTIKLHNCFLRSIFSYLHEGYTHNMFPEITEIFFLLVIKAP